MDLVVEDGSRVDTVYFLMSEKNVQKKIALPWVSFCSDSASVGPHGVFLQSNPHPRAYGSFARLLGKYVRDEHVIDLATAVPQDDRFAGSKPGAAESRVVAAGLLRRRRRFRSGQDCR